MIFCQSYNCVIQESSTNFKMDENQGTATENYQKLQDVAYYLFTALGMNFVSPKYKPNLLTVATFFCSTSHIFCSFYSLFFMGQNMKMLLQSLTVTGYGFIVRNFKVFVGDINIYIYIYICISDEVLSFYF